MNANILIVDDNATNLALLGDVLRSSHRVLLANSGQRALELAVAKPLPDLILLDVMMPQMDGYETLARLRRNPSTCDIPVIFVSALNEPGDEERGLALGAVDYIGKPIRPPIVRARVRTHLELKLTRDRLRARNDHLEAEVASRLEENQVIENVTVHALARIAQTRDNETGNHLRRTQEYVGLLARKLATHPRFAPFLDERTIVLLEKSAPLHDIGKVGIPDYILLKPGLHTPEERAIMRTHPRLGARAIEQAEQDAARPVKFLQYAKEIALHHHERWDGSGYPDGLRGDEIPIPARLMAIADVFDALLSRRPYKAPFPRERVRAEIRAGRGTQFDPDIVDCFLDGIEAFEAIATRLRDDADTVAPAAAEARALAHAR